MHLFLIFTGKIQQLFFCLVRNTADISQASPAKRMVNRAVTGTLLFLAQYPLQDERSAIVFPDIPYNVFFGVTKTVTNKILIHGVTSICLPFSALARFPHKHKSLYVGETLFRFYPERPGSGSSRRQTFCRSLCPCARR